MTDCPFCDGSCRDAQLPVFIEPGTAWLWEQLALLADRRGDPDLTSGQATVTAPPGAMERAAATALIGGKLSPGGRRSIDLAKLATVTAPASPGAVAAHAVGRRLAVRATARAARPRPKPNFEPGAKTCSLRHPETKSGWLCANEAGSRSCLSHLRILDRGVAVLVRLPPPGGPAVDRRVLAQQATGFPHDLDDGQPVAGFCRAFLSVTGRVPERRTAPRRLGRSGSPLRRHSRGVDHRQPRAPGLGRALRRSVTVPPHVLANCEWPAGDGTVAFVTENPSVLGAAAATAPGAHVICMSGTPSRTEVAALRRLAQSGWALHVRADFDDAGLAHAAAVLAAAPGSLPWRLGAADCMPASNREGPQPLRRDRLPARVVWIELVPAMRDAGVAVFEEAFWAELLADVTGWCADVRRPLGLEGVVRGRKARPPRPDGPGSKTRANRNINPGPDHP